MFAEGKNDKAVAVLRIIADKEDKLGNEPEGIPAREMIADMLLEAKRPQQALAEYQTDLKLNPNRFDGTLRRSPRRRNRRQAKRRQRILRNPAESLRRIEFNAAGTEPRKRTGGAEIALKNLSKDLLREHEAHLQSKNLRLFRLLKSPLEFLLVWLLAAQYHHLQHQRRHHPRCPQQRILLAMLQIQLQ